MIDRLSSDDALGCNSSDSTSALPMSANDSLKNFSSETTLIFLSPSMTGQLPEPTERGFYGN